MWTQTLSLSPYASRHALVVDLGVEPAIEIDGERHTFFDHRRVSVRWLVGTVLTGLIGAALIGSTIYAALDHESNFAAAPTLALPQQKDVADDTASLPKGDRLVKPVDIVAAKQMFHVAQPTKVGDREVMRNHLFARVETTLVTTPAGFADEVPPFNPLQVLADARAPVEAPADIPQDDADFSWATRDLASASLTSAVALSNDEVEAQVTEHVKNSLAAGNRPFSLPSQLLLMRTSRANPLGALSYAAATAGFARSPFASIEVRMVPENVTVMPRAPSPAPGTPSDEKLVVMSQGSSLENLLLVSGVARDSVRAIVSAIGGPVQDGRRLKLLFTDTEDATPRKVLARLSIYNGETPETTVALRDDGAYVRTAGEEAHLASAKPADDDDDSGAMRLYNALYETALKQDIPKPIIDDMVRIFANDVDLQRGVAGGDSFEAFYDRGDGDDVNKLLFASISTHGETYRYYRFQSPDDGSVDYYDPNGRSSRKFLVRAPMLSFKITSGFGIRYHPILGYTRPHTGTDFAAPIGSPIFAAGNGTIVQAGWSSGYGRRIEIQHANGYTTTYNHLSGFARGISEGVRVRQGQTIGYLGQSGLATGPHLHYEVLVNGHFVDPMKVKLARTKEFDGHMLALFMKERGHIDELLQKAPQMQLTAQR
ncbi:Murein DD-endopeptidase MepM and murein hydrolase activator NlpD, contain LysM domain [Beijerinckiaceae bacterium RH AL1]|nr:Murein DD-endopeptidase MepM and murein hydrolase activator NlpD, contain LysM domain [Beijerinckiaceae bacterium RH AL8]VVB42430.1 Murein DD-endopeptidase MepM and murein hydrolase activator NlpD, contain LysM domain [Beijerinckiaceae bacterium RH CH11]VVC53305.1 Murein DD-endopeptidase MepM and murein hydrolase activator NlpD, contain LysM domain [Beijerinckiaceae bacterium RH AL1]